MTDVPADMPLEHVLRSGLPWRPTERMTECGRQANDVKAWITRDDAIAKFKRLGKQRAALTTCLTCVETANRHGTWDRSPSAVMSRYLDRYWAKSTDPAVGQMDAELRAVALLIDAHQDEFREAVEGLLAAGSLEVQRAKRGRR